MAFWKQMLILGNPKKESKTYFGTKEVLFQEEFSEKAPKQAASQEH